MQIERQNHPRRVLKLKKPQKPVWRDFTYTQVLNDEDLTRKTLDVLNNEDSALHVVVPEILAWLGAVELFLWQLSGILITVFLTFHMIKSIFGKGTSFISGMILRHKILLYEVNEVFFGSIILFLPKILQIHFSEKSLKNHFWGVTQ